MSSSSEEEVAIYSLRIADFYLCFPSRLIELSPPNSIAGMRKRRNALMKNIEKNEYELLPSSQIIFERMEVIQEAAISVLARLEILKVWRESGHRYSSLNVEKIPPPIISEVNGWVSESIDLMNFVSNDIILVPLLGGSGLKFRSGLGEHSYDAV